LVTREPGGTPLGEAIREWLLGRNTLRAETEALLFTAARAEHVWERIRPALARGTIVLCDRYVDSTLAYQGAGRGLDERWLRELHRVATGDLWPDLTVLLDVPVELGLARRRAAGETLTRLDSELTRTGPGLVPHGGTARAHPLAGYRRDEGTGDGGRGRLDSGCGVLGAEETDGPMSSMKLVIAVVQARDADKLLHALQQEGFRATRISSTGGFLREQNVTVLIGVEATRLEQVLRIIKANCYTRTQYVNPLLPIVESGEFFVPQPIEVEVGGANVFVVPVERFERIP
jgi:uncharacterized protein YaaQ